MKCLRIDLKRSFAAYVNGELSPRAVKRLEDHLLDCGECRTSLARIRGGHHLASQLPFAEPQHDDWGAIERAIDADEAQPVACASAAPRRRAYRRGSWARPEVSLAAVAIAVVLLLLLLATNLHRFRERETRLMASDAVNLGEFHLVSIADLERSSKPHVVTEGYVSEVRVNDEDGDLSFKLVDDLSRPGPFVVCEIIDPIRIDPPAVGSRVRVYGVSRFDSQVDHQWYEVHPVLNIEAVRR